MPYENISAAERVFGHFVVSLAALLIGVGIGFWAGCYQTTIQNRQFLCQSEGGHLAGNPAILCVHPTYGEAKVIPF